MKYKIIKNICLIFLGLISLHINSQSKSVYRAVEGGSVNVVTDSITQLAKLVLKLEQPWKFEQTGKQYWIGYTDYMFSIAYYESEAIPFLRNILEKTDSYHAKIGALYTLHLIGIKSTIAGRFYENFQDTLARTTIISYLNEPDLHETVLSLLMRDPWLTDIPHFIKYLSNSNNECYKIMSVLQRYSFNGQPLGQELPREILKQKINIKHKFIDEIHYEFHDFQDLIGLKDFFGDKVIIDKDILETEDWKYYYEYSKNDSLKSVEKRIGGILRSLTNSPFSYCMYENKYFYKYENELIYIYDLQGAKKIWLDWWKNNKNKEITATNKEQ